MLIRGVLLIPVKNIYLAI